MITIFTTNWCSSCVAAKRFLTEQQLEFKEVNIEEENITRMDLNKLTGKYTVPQIIINDKCIGGYDQLIQLHQSNKLKVLLNE